MYLPLTILQVILLSFLISVCSNISEKIAIVQDPGGSPNG